MDAGNHLKSRIYGKIENSQIRNILLCLTNMLLMLHFYGIFLTILFLGRTKQ